MQCRRMVNQKLPLDFFWFLGSHTGYHRAAGGAMLEDFQVTNCVRLCLTVAVPQLTPITMRNSSNKDVGNIYQTMAEGRGSGEDNFREEGIDDNDDEGLKAHVPHGFTQSLNLKRRLLTASLILLPDFFDSTTSGFAYDSLAGLDCPWKLLASP
ncbi:hypothetical protein EI94DRAFT_1703637 [Lactarius quietus]|nr:hypothetical protein EI94DRAFT_1703637 [Lactarius quietus]